MLGILILCIIILSCRGATPRPSGRPTLAPTTAALSPVGGWIYANAYEDQYCKGTPFNVTGTRMNECLPLYGRGNQPRGSFLFTNCVQGVSANYAEWSTPNCAGTPSVQTIIKGGCTNMTDPNSPDVWHVSSVNCQPNARELPQLPSGMVLETKFGDCTQTQPVAFSAQSTLKCNMNALGNAFTQLYALSSSYACDDTNGTPQTVGYLGTHCSKKSFVSTLSQSCATTPSWQSGKYSTASQFSCTPPKVLDKPTGWLTQTYFDSSDCSGSVLSVTGQATGVCTVGYDSSSVIVQSKLVRCDGTYLYQSPDCTGTPVTVTSLPQGSCQANSNGYGIRFGGNGGSYSVGCSNDYSTIPRPYNGHSIVLYQYNNDLCAGDPVTFNKMPQDQPYTSGSVNRPYTQQVSCASSNTATAATLSINLGASATTGFSLFLDTGCSYIDQSYSSALGGRRGSNSPVFYSSQQYTSCEGTQLVNGAPNPPTATNTTKQQAMPGEQLAIIVWACLATLALLALGCHRYFHRSQAYSSSSSSSVVDGNGRVELAQEVQNPLFESDADENTIPP